jgi:tetratricopeptide (TPR) repeat protein
MRGTFLTAVLAGLFVTTASAHAGLYNTEEPQLGYAFADFRAFKNEIDRLQSILAEGKEKDPNSARFHVFQRIKALEAKRADGSLTYQDRINLSAYYVRLNQPEKAVALLEQLPRSERDFLASSNLATASQLAGRLERAEGYLVEALENWPKVSLLCTSFQLNWLRLAEQYHLKLIRSRLLEARDPRSASVQSVDPLFPRVRFIGPSGQYEPGLIASEQWANMPADALNLVRQLVLWMPLDKRLTWLLAEMLNSAGEVEAALRLMNELDAFQANFRPAEFVAHHRVLQEWKDTVQTLLAKRPRFIEEKARSSLAPLAYLLPPGPGFTLEATGTVQALHKVNAEPLPEYEPTVSPIEPPSPASEASRPWTLEWRQIAVGFVVGVVVALLLSLQLRELRKRRQQQDAEPASKP